MRPTALVPWLSSFIVACASAPRGVEFVEDDWQMALARGQAEDKPVFVDMWAPWCHSCLALKAEVLTDPALRPLANRFVWASLDSERPSSAAFIERHPLPALPTLWVIDPRNDQPILRWVGTMTAPQLVEVLQDAESAYRGVGSVDATRLLLEGDAAAAKGDNAAAIVAWQAALAQSADTWPKRSRAANALTFALAAADRHAECVATAEAELAKTRPGATGRPDLAIGGIDCATELEGEAKTQPLVRLVAIAEEIAKDEAILGDDRSGAWMAVIDGKKALGDTDGAKRAAESWSTALDALAMAAPNAKARAVYDAHRMSAYLEIGQGEKALPMLAQSERDFPDDYNPPARLAYTLLQLGRLNEALDASSRAEAKVYGPRALRVLSIKADILEKQGDSRGAADAVRRALAAAEALPPAQRSAKLVKSLSERLARLAPPNP